jgi:iron-sulfur cluster assembly accessory protein
MCVTITPRAASFMRTMTRMHAAPAAAGMRLQVRAGGCSGLDSSFDIENEPHPGDTVLEQEGARLFLPEASCALLRDHTIDYGESRLDGRLRFIRPNGATACDIGSCSAKNHATAIIMRPAPSAARCG